MDYCFIYSAIIFSLGLYSMLLSILNYHFNRRVEVKKPYKTNKKLVSILVPARNEESRIPTLLDSLTDQDYDNYEVIIIDDQSDDKTVEVVEEYIERYPNIFKLVKVLDKPKGVNGKTNALCYGLKEAKGEYIISTDADTIFNQDCISYSVAMLEKYNLDMISGFPKEECSSSPTRLAISAMCFSQVFYIPLLLAFKRPSRIYTLAIGQFLLMKADVLKEINGYESILTSIVDDVSLAKHFVKNKRRYALMPLSKHISCNMYNDFKSAFHSISRSIGGLFGRASKLQIFLVIFIVIALLLLSLSPIIALIFLILGYFSSALLTLLGFIFTTIGWRAITKSNQYDRAVGYSYPIVLLIICAMYLNSYIHTLFNKGYNWKNRTISS